MAAPTVVGLERTTAPGDLVVGQLTLVLSGEFDSLTTPAEGALTAGAFPAARQVIVANSFHVTAVGDADTVRSDSCDGSSGTHALAPRLASWAARTRWPRCVPWPATTARTAKAHRLERCPDRLRALPRCTRRANDGGT